MIKCQAHILKEYKTVRADSCWPNYNNYDSRPPCDGELILLVTASTPVYYGDDAELSYTFECSRCKNPYHPKYFNGISNTHYALDITKLLED